MEKLTKMEIMLLKALVQQEIDEVRRVQAAVENNPSSSKLTQYAINQTRLINYETLLRKLG